MTTRRWRMPRLLLSLLMTGLLLPGPVVGQEPAPAPGVEDSAALAEVRDLIKSGDYDGAIESLEVVIERASGNTATLREAYLQLIKTYVFMGNELRFKPQGREASKLHYDAARRRTGECLSIPELRHTRPEPETEYPQEMVSIFAEVRDALFGSFRIVRLDPPDARVTLDGDSLGSAPGDTLLGDVDLAVGTHLVVVRRDGYREIVDEVTISAGATLEKSYTLPRRRSRTWYMATVGAGLGVVGGLVALLAGGGGEPGQTPLPAAPSPPGN